MYAITNYCHRKDIDMGQHAFTVLLSPEWKGAVAASGIDQAQVNRLIESQGRTWLDAVGYDRIFDPDNCGAWADKSKPPGPNAHPQYEPRTSIRVSWGEWGPEHISVPGNACGLDIERRAFGSPWRGGAALHPHNLDSLRQKYLLTIVFTEIAYSVLLFSREKAAV